MTTAKSDPMMPSQEVTTRERYSSGGPESHHDSQVEQARASDRGVSNRQDLWRK
jgi:hypothetical protein